MEDATTFTRQTTFTKAADILPHPSLPPATELARCWRLIHKFKTYLRLDVDIILVYHLQTRTRNAIAPDVGHDTNLLELPLPHRHSLSLLASVSVSRDSHIFEIWYDLVNELAHIIEIWYDIVKKLAHILEIWYDLVNELAK
ncbi:hypothetical protein J6590_003008 [Homalodisca vitripennis]|nr:hypothetical protein J6590_003008 [Homalodisca vitripennis]